MKDTKKIIRRLLNISQLIIDEIDVLSNLSYLDKEKTSQFSQHVKDISDYLNQEKIIINNLNLNELKSIYKDLEQYDDDSDVYARTSILIDDKISDFLDAIDMMDSLGGKEEDNDDNDYQDMVDEEMDINDDDLVNKYHESEEENEKYAIKVINSVATIAIKNMLKRIEYTIADNKVDIKYKKTLIRNFRKFKYFFFTLDNDLEVTGAKYNFNVNLMPMPYKFNFDTSLIYYNECVTILDKLYSFKDINYKPDDLLEALFNMMMFEIYLNGINPEYISKLNELSLELDNKYGTNYYGKMAKQKILNKRS